MLAEKNFQIFILPLLCGGVEHRAFACHLRGFFSGKSFCRAFCLCRLPMLAFEFSDPTTRTHDRSMSGEKKIGKRYTAGAGVDIELRIWRVLSPVAV